MRLEIKKCPFCGSEAEIRDLYVDYWTDNDDEPIKRLRFVCECTGIKCWVSPFTNAFDTEEEAIEAWNRRSEGAIKTLEQEPRWIPVSEKLPEEDGEYLLFGKIYEDEENYVFIGEYDSCGEQFGIWQEQFDRRTLGCLGSEFFEYSSVIAWQPLPQPYRAESEEKQW